MSETPQPLSDSQQSSETTPTFQVIVLSGPSGSGKSTIVDLLVARSPILLVKSISATTRPPRDCEIHGKDYYFLSADEFEEKRQAGDFLEYAEVHRSGFWYGTLKSELDRAQKLGGWSFLEIDVQGALSTMETYPDALTLFLKTPSDEEFERRLRTRGTEAEEQIAKRLQTARDELKFADQYDYQVINDDLDRAVDEICEILSRREAQLNA